MERRPDPAPLDWADLEGEATALVRLAASRGISLAAAESCTGGLVGAAMTAVPGASEVFLGAIVAYADEVKRDVLGVDTVALYGSASAETAAAMAAGARRVLEADIAVSVTGVAGPEGGTPLAPVGAIWFGLATREGVTTESHHFAGDRRGIRMQSAARALALLLEALGGR